VQVVGHREVEHVDGVVVQEVAVVGALARDAVDAVKPAQSRGVGVAHGDELRAHGMLLQRAPTPDGGCQLAAHEAAADDADTDGRERHGPASPWTMARSLRTMATGSGCWMTLRP
jgi:hypothetical protein